MIVARMVWHVQPGKVEQVAEMLSQFLHDPDHPMKRVYIPKISPLHRVVFEEEYESVAEWERHRNEWGASEFAAEFMPKWYEPMEGGGTEEIWELVG
jgi:hypothetical protein